MDVVFKAERRPVEEVILDPVEAAVVLYYLDAAERRGPRGEALRRQLEVLDLPSPFSPSASEDYGHVPQDALRLGRVPEGAPGVAAAERWLVSGENAPQGMLRIFDNQEG